VVFFFVIDTKVRERVRLRGTILMKKKAQERRSRRQEREKYNIIARKLYGCLLPLNFPAPFFRMQNKKERRVSKNNITLTFTPA
jgi:hypothetical protein